MPPEKKIAIVTPTFNGIKDIPEFLSSLQATTDLSIVQLVIVDNHSQDKTVQYIQQRLPSAHIIQNTENKGFVACNQGMQYALDNGAEYVYLANQDLMFGEQWYQPLIHAMSMDKTIAAAQSKMMMHPDRDTINSCGNALHFLGFGYMLGSGKKDTEYPCNRITDVAYCSGAAVMYSTKALAHVGMFDESFFMYHEDSDLCWRFLLSGYRCVVVPESRVFHRYEFSRSIQKFYFIERNRISILLKHYRLCTLILLFPIFLFWECGMLCYSMLAGICFKKSLGFKEKIAAYAYFFSVKNMKAIMRERKKVQALRTISDKEATKLFTAKIIFQDIENPLILYIANPISTAYWRAVRFFV
ncbi:glycosyltransferase family 2 protein [Candidatus Uhrbacteria bacterium]|nr:glycosyltransferase family 2 protein [Candidatus Uhrbacteria bacterium]